MPRLLLLLLGEELLAVLVARVADADVGLVLDEPPAALPLLPAPVPVLSEDESPSAATEVTPVASREGIKELKEAVNNKDASIFVFVK